MAACHGDAPPVTLIVRLVNGKCMCRSAVPVSHHLVVAGSLAALLGLFAALASLPSGSEPRTTAASFGGTTPSASAPETVMASGIEGRTLDDWRELMNTLDHDDPARADYVPGLIEIVQSKDIPWFTRRQAAVTLGRWGPPAVTAIPVLGDLLSEADRDAEEATVFWALKALSLFGPDASPVGSKVATLLRDERRPVEQRLAAMECLSQTGTAYPPGITALTQSAQAGNSPVLQRAAIEALGLFRGGAPSAVPVLIRALDAPDADIRREAATALGRHGPNAEIAQAALFDRFIGDDDPGVRDAAGLALSQTGTAAIPLVIALLDQEDMDLRHRSATVLGRWRQSAAAAAPALKLRWDDPDAAVRLAALEAYWKVTLQGDMVAPRVAGELTDLNRNIRRQAYLLLIALGPSARSARLVLEGQLQHSRPEVRSAAQKLLAMQPSEK